MKRWIYEKGSVLHKYALPLYLSMLFASWVLKDFEWYHAVWSVWCSITLLYFGLYMLYWAYIKEWCKWQKSTIIGIMMFAVVDIAFYGNYYIMVNGNLEDNPYYNNAELIVLIISLFVVSFYMKFEKAKICEHL